MTTAEKLALEVLDALNAGEIDRVGALVHEDFVDHGAPPWAPQGRAGYLTILGFVHDALKIRYELHDVVAAGSHVAIRATAHGMHDVDFLGFAPTGKEYAMPTMHMYAERDGLVRALGRPRRDPDADPGRGARCSAADRFRHLVVTTRHYSSPARAEATRANRQRILDAARQLFLKRGYVGTTVEAVAGRAGVSARPSTTPSVARPPCSRPSTT